MPLSPPVSRQLRHRRAIHAEAYERADGLWDIEACLTDQKPRDVALASGVRPNGLPIHELWLRITIDRKLTVVDAETSSDWVPYPGQCETANSAYRALIGLNLLNNFRRDATRLLAGTAGCTHLTELCAVLPTAAIQAFAGDVWNTKNGGPDGKHEQGNEGNEGHASNGTDNASSTTQTTRSIDKPPFQLGRCHALRFDGEAVRQFYPRWHGHAPRSARAETAGEPCANAAANAASANDTTDTSDKNSNQVQSNSQTEGNHA